MVLFIGSAQGQFVEFQQIQWNKRSLQTANLRTTETLAIPFWDDFAQGIDSLKWTLEGVSFTETIGNNAPSFGMVLFNGVDQMDGPTLSKSAIRVKGIILPANLLIYRFSVLKKARPYFLAFSGRQVARLSFLTVLTT